MKQAQAITVGITIALVALAGCGGGDATPTSAGTPAASTSTPSAPPTLDPAVVESARAARAAKEASDAAASKAFAASQSAANAPKAESFTIGIKVLKQSCYGSAGCNVTFRIDPSYAGALNGDYEVTYTVTGDESGPKINTFTVESGEAHYDSTETASTKSAKTVLTAKVTDVSPK